MDMNRLICKLAMIEKMVPNGWNFEMGTKLLSMPYKVEDTIIPKFHHQTKVYVL